MLLKLKQLHDALEEFYDYNTLENKKVRKEYFQNIYDALYNLYLLDLHQNNDSFNPTDESFESFCEWLCEEFKNA